ncbi:MAG: hydrolase [Burkholderiales bacterium]|jgi:predicted alpha/beta-fold hydrolase
MPESTPYRAPWWLPGSHLQTIYPYLALRSRAPAYRRERIETRDGDFIDFDWIGRDADAPTVVLFHGLEGCSRSHYARHLMHAVAARGWRGVVAHFRGCSGEPNRLLRAYHSGDASEIDWMLRLIASRTNNIVFAVGVSLGGNALLKWLAREQKDACFIVTAACAISAPIDLMIAGNRLGQGLNRFYGRHFLRTLKPKALEKLARYPDAVRARQVRSASTLRAFDDAFTAPVHGFKSVDDYWSTASTKAELGKIAVPTLIVHARNDPFLPGQFLPEQVLRESGEQNPSIECEFPDQGGHVGFVSGAFPGNLSWLPKRVLGYLGKHLPQKPPSGNVQPEPGQQQQNT